MIKKFHIIEKVFFAIVFVLVLAGCSSRADFSFTQLPVVLKAADGTAGREGEYVLFGDWPQTLKAENVTVDENQSLEAGLFVMYQGSDGYWYVKAAEKAFNSSSSYSDGTPVARSRGVSRYFKVEPIKWRILDWDYRGTGNALLLAESMLETAVPFYPGCESRIIQEQEVYANNYKYSTMRAYLTGHYLDTDTQLEEFKPYVEEGRGFLQSAFTESARELLCYTEVDNSAFQMSYDGQQGVQELYACPDTVDQVFLISTMEAINPAYGFDSYDSSESKARIRHATDYALARGCYESIKAEFGGYWWLRSPYYGCNYDIRYVSDNATMEHTDYVFDEIDGIVPAICLPSDLLK